MFSVKIPKVGISTGPALETSAPQDSSPLASTSISPGYVPKLKTVRRRGLKRGIWAVTSVEGTKLCMKKRRRANFRPEDQEAFYRLLEDPVIQSFLEADVFLRVSDKYLLSMVVEYFGRVGLPGDCYNRIHFFLALYIACDMEEDNPVSKWSIFPFVLGKEDWPILYKEFLRLQADFFHAMGGRAWVTPEICEELHARRTAAISHTMPVVPDRTPRDEFNSPDSLRTEIHRAQRIMPGLATRQNETTLRESPGLEHPRIESII